MSFRLRRSVADHPQGRHPIVQALLQTLPGRAVLGGAGVKATAELAQQAAGDSLTLETLGTAGTLALLGGLGYFLIRLIGGARRHLLWRVRRKLILSYIFVGFVPALLIIVFCLLCGWLLFGTVSQYIVQSRLRDVVEQASFRAQTTAIEVSQLTSEAEAEAYLARTQGALSTRYAASSLAVIPLARECPDAPPPVTPGRFVPDRSLTAGPWPHIEPPRALPGWITCDGFAGLLAYSVAVPEGSAPASRPAGGDTYLAVRAVAVAEGRSPAFAVVLDVPMTEEAARRLREDTGIELRDVLRGTTTPQPARPGARAPLTTVTQSEAAFASWFVFLDFVDWASGRTDKATLSIGMRIGEVYDRLSPASVGDMSFGRALVLIIVVVGVLFLLIQFVALVMGLALARSITGSVHELFVGTVRVQQGDFSHRIDVKARDQLGELADSFNVMTSRLTELLAQMAEKKRLEEELRIAREIQMSLLPQGPARMPGLTVTAHCSPAREVGGDYYDFLPIDEHRIGILIADVSGKGTSAALYMAELKGLMLSLSQIHQSPRNLMVAANRIIADNLDSRSFITMTYAVLDLEHRTMTYARAGHTPLIHLPAQGAGGRVQVLVPDGMVLGLTLDDGERFETLLEEVTIPLETGDIFVLFTDGISEAMNEADELFGEARLGELVESHATLPFDELRERILRDVRAFTGEPGPHDDMTLILIKVEEPVGPPHRVAPVGRVELNPIPNP